MTARKFDCSLENSHTQDFCSISWEDYLGTFFFCVHEYKVGNHVSLKKKCVVNLSFLRKQKTYLDLLN